MKSSTLPTIIEDFLARGNVPLPLYDDSPLWRRFLGKIFNIVDGFRSVTAFIGSLAAHFLTLGL
jgi:hypothetical protein